MNLMSVLRFTGQDGEKYEVPLSATGENMPSVQFENLKVLLKLTKTAQSGSDYEAMSKFTDAFWQLIAYDFFKAYPMHYLACYYHPVKGLDDSAMFRFAALLGDDSETVKGIFDQLTNAPKEDVSLLNKTPVEVETYEKGEEQSLEPVEPVETLEPKSAIKKKKPNPV